MLIFSPNTASRNNYALSMEIYKEVNVGEEPIFWYKSSTDVNLNITNNLNTYPRV